MSYDCRCSEVDLPLSPPGGTLRSSPYPMVEVSHALQHVLQVVQSLSTGAAIRHAFVPLQEAKGCISAQQRHATQPLPPFPASIMDGYAVLSSDGAGEYPVVGASTAGSTAPAASSDFQLQPGQVVYITTGAPVPNGADAVIPVEWTSLPDPEDKSTVRILQPIAAGANIRPVGCDMAVGQTILHAGQKIGPAEIGVLASVGITSVHVIDKPTVGVLSSGNEVLEFGTEELEFGQIRDSNRPMLLSLLSSAGARTVDLGIVSDSTPDVEKKIMSALNQVDMLVVSGGVSMGEFDLIKPLLKRIGTVHFGRLNMKPGKPTTFATVPIGPSRTPKLVFALPGNPVSSLVTAQLLVLPAIKAWREGVERVNLHTHGFPRFPVRTTTPLKKDVERPEYHRVYVWFDEEAGEYLAESTGSQMSSRLLSGCMANGLIVVQKGSGEVPVGTQVQCMLVGEWDLPRVGNTKQAQAPPLPAKPADLAAAAPVSHSRKSSEAKQESSAIQTSSTSPSTTATPASSSSPPPFSMRVSVLTVSDRCSSGESEDVSGPAIIKLLQSTPLKHTNVSILNHRCVSDDQEAIVSLLKEWCDTEEEDKAPHLILTTGGTGFAPRDITPEAVASVLERESSGLVFAMLQSSFKATPMAALSRPVAGSRGRSLILTLPGSPKAIPEILTPVLPVLPHAVKLLQSKNDPHTAPSPQPVKGTKQ